MLLGASVSVQAVLAIGPALIGSIALVAVNEDAVSSAICQLLGLPIRTAILVACGNFAMAAVAPVIDVDGDVIDDG